MPAPTLWERVKVSGKTGFDSVWKAADKLGAPVNKLSNKLGSEAFWPTTLDKESDKAARILKSFCRDGFYAEEETTSTDGPKQKQKVLTKISTDVIKNARGLAIFTTMRTGLWMSGAGGSGILIAKRDDGTWSPPSGILLHTAGLGFMVGVDIYDCVVVINSERALEAFYKVRCTLGSEISIAAGPIGAGGVLDTEVHKRQAPIFTYMKSRGFYAGVQIDGTIVVERKDENERFYGQRIGVEDILAGQVHHPPVEIKRLLETIKAAQGDTDFDLTALPAEPPPGDYAVDDGHVFGVPDREDPDPYGVLALEKEGMGVVEAGTKKRASWEQFSFNPSPSSPVHDVWTRGTGTDKDRPETVVKRSSWRTSAASVWSAVPKTPSSLRNSADLPRPSTRMADSSTQTDGELPESPSKNSLRGSRRGSRSSGLLNGQTMYIVPEHDVLDTPTSERVEAPTLNKTNGYTTPPHTPPMSSPKSFDPDFNPPAVVMEEKDEAEEDEDDEEDVHIEEPVVHSIQAVKPVSPRAMTVSRPRIVTVPKRIAPQLPVRNPHRRGPLIIGASPVDSSFEGSPDKEHASPLPSPDKESHGHHEDHDETTSLEEKMHELKFNGEEEEEDDQEDDLAGKWAKAHEAIKQDSPTNHKMPGGFD